MTSVTILSDTPQRIEIALQYYIRNSLSRESDEPSENDGAATLYSLVSGHEEAIVHFEKVSHIDAELIGLLTALPMRLRTRTILTDVSDWHLSSLQRSGVASLFTINPQ